MSKCLNPVTPRYLVIWESKENTLGMISVAEVGYALTSLGEKLSEEEVDQMVGQYADMEGEGRFNKADFVARIKW